VNFHPHLNLKKAVKVRVPRKAVRAPRKAARVEKAKVVAKEVKEVKAARAVRAVKSLAKEKERAEARAQRAAKEKERVVIIAEDKDNNASKFLHVCFKSNIR